MKNTQKRDTILIIAVLFGIIAILYVLTLKGSRRRQMERRPIQIQTESVNIITPESDLSEEMEVLPAEATTVIEPHTPATEMISADEEILPAADIVTTEVSPTPVTSPASVSEGITQVNLTAE